MFAGAGEKRLEFRRVTTSRYQGAVPTPLGSGSSWRHNYYWHVYSYPNPINPSGERIEVNYPVGTTHTFESNVPTDLYMTAEPSIGPRIEHASSDTKYYLTMADA